MITRFRLAACLASFVAVVASREGAAAAYGVDPATRSTTVLSTDGFIIRMAQDEPAASATQTPDSADGQDTSGSSNPPPQDSQ